MFRRKDESDTATPESGLQDSMPNSGSSNTVSQEPATASSAVAGIAAAVASHTSNPYAPSSHAAARPSAPATGSYRPAPLADFARTTPASRSSEPMRSPSNHSSVGSSMSAPSFSTLSEKTGQKSNRRVLTVGNDILLKGEIATCDRLVIEGRVEAKLSEVHTVEIAECGSFKGTAEVEDAEISGVFEGDLIVRNRLVIYSSGEVRGNITYGEIEIERGGRLTGQIKTVAVSGSVQMTSKGAGLSAQEVKARAASKETFAA